MTYLSENTTYIIAILACVAYFISAYMRKRRKTLLLNSGSVFGAVTLLAWDIDMLIIAINSNENDIGTLCNSKSLVIFGGALITLVSLVAIGNAIGYIVTNKQGIFDI
jgi:hypothetical protein